VDCGIAEEFIIKMADTIGALAVDQLHIIGDIFDRGAHPDDILDFLLDYPNKVDFQWGNHDIVWMGAATGNWRATGRVFLWLRQMPERMPAQQTRQHH
jgi:fructose-1,6-bisphosphatase-3